ncbi:hypothetical protein T484DRAFT_3067857 [Baffinella frigidus]|nr:hypothetical protein T484DRAFT_3067857 [Cryptophyta sp. CCMP2293]
MDAVHPTAAPSTPSRRRAAFLECETYDKTYNELVPPHLSAAMKFWSEDACEQVRAIGCRGGYPLMAQQLHPSSMHGFADAGGLEELLEVMRSNGADSGIVEMGCAVLRNMAVSDTLSYRISAAGGIQQVTSANLPSNVDRGHLCQISTRQTPNDKRPPPQHRGMCTTKRL